MLRTVVWYILYSSSLAVNDQNKYKSSKSFGGGRPVIPVSSHFQSNRYSPQNWRVDVLLPPLVFG